MKRREFHEISDDEWDNHSFKSSRVFQNPPPIESFAFRSQQNTLTISDDDDDCVEVSGNGKNLEGNVAMPSRSNLDKSENLEDEDVDMEQSVPVNRGRRFVVDDDDDDDEDGEVGNDFAEVFDLDSSEDDELEEVAEDEDEDLVGRTLQKCAKISAELKRDLYGGTVMACDRYAEVEAASVRIVTQVIF